MPDLSPEDRRKLVRLVDQQSAGRDRLTQSLVRFVLNLIRRTPDRGFYDPVVVRSNALAMSRQVRTAQVATAGLTSQYVRQTMALQGVQPGRGRVVLPAQLRGTAGPILESRGRPLDVVDLDNLADLPPAPEVPPADLAPIPSMLEEYQRPAEQYRYARSTGMDRLEALERASQRAQALAEDDLTLAMREAVVQDLDRDRDGLQVVGYRRIIHPELSKSGVCGLCLAASDRVYLASEHLPFHGSCKCEVLPITNEGDPGSDLNKDELKALYEAAGGTDAASLKRVRYAVEYHGELGPVITVDGQHFRSVNDLPDVL